MWGRCPRRRLGLRTECGWVDGVTGLVGARRSCVPATGRESGCARIRRQGCCCLYRRLVSKDGCSPDSCWPREESNGLASAGRAMLHPLGARTRRAMERQARKSSTTRRGQHRARVDPPPTWAHLQGRSEAAIERGSEAVESECEASLPALIFRFSLFLQAPPGGGLSTTTRFCPSPDAARPTGWAVLVLGE